jgi:hypothetical protein
VNKAEIPFMIGLTLAFIIGGAVGYFGKDKINVLIAKMKPKAK